LVLGSKTKDKSSGKHQFQWWILSNRCHPYRFHSATTTANGFLGLYRWSPRHNDHFQLGTACHFPMLDLFTACRNRLELSPLDRRKLYITTIYDRDFHSSFQKNEPTVHPSLTWENGMRFLTESDHCGVETTDKGLKKRWRWSSLSEKDKDGIDWGEWCKKTYKKTLRDELQILL
jgi:hypothetical protein